MSTPQSGPSGIPDLAVPERLVPEDNAEDLYEHAPCGYLSTSPDGTIIRVNETLLTLTGFRREELVGCRRFTDLLTPGGRIYHETHYAPLLTMQGSVREIALDLACADGRRLPVLVNSILVRDTDGEPHVIRTSVFDATFRRSYEQELLRARQRAEDAEAHARLLARTLQASLMPPTPPAIPGLDLAAVYRPAGAGDQIGGDFYDVFTTGGGEWVVVLGDVRGKGAAAAAVTALARYTLRAAAMHTRRPSAVLATLNAALLDDPTDRFCTVVYLSVQPNVGGPARITLACGGHPLPILIGPDGPSTVGKPGTLLGVLDEPDLHDTAFILQPGESLFCYTDGLVEGRRDAEEFGSDRLLDALARHQHRPVAEVAQGVVDEIVRFQDGHPRDDMAALLLVVPTGD